jgi:hypothetical protein
MTSSLIPQGSQHPPGRRVPNVAPALRLPRTAVRWAPVIGAFLAVRLYLVAVAGAHGLPGLDARTWARWDSFQYLSIAVEGYRLGVSDGHNSGYKPGTPIGNDAWMPAYPLLIRAGHHLGAPVVQTGWWLSAAFAAAMLWAIDRLIPDDVPRRRRAVVLLLAAFFPGFVYAHAVFPISLEILLLAISLRLTASGRWTLGGVAGAAAAFTYTSGAVVGPVMGLWAVVGTGERGGPDGLRGACRRGTRMVLPALLPFLGTGAVMVMQRVDTGRWDAMRRIQSRYGVGLIDPVRGLAHILSFATSTDRSLSLSVLQVAAVAVVWVAAIGMTVAGWRTRPAVDRLLAVAAAAYWLVPTSMGLAVSPWRVLALLAPLLPPLARRLPTPVLCVILAVFLVLGWAMCGRFLDNTAI